MQSVFWAPACSLKKRPKADGDPSRELQTLNLSKRSVEHGSLCSEWFETMEATAVSTSLDQSCRLCHFPSLMFDSRRRHCGLPVYFGVTIRWGSVACCSPLIFAGGYLATLPRRYPAKEIEDEMALSSWWARATCAAQELVVLIRQLSRQHRQQSNYAMWRSVLSESHDDVPRSSDVWATRSAAGSGRSLRETPACDAHRESRTSGVRACGSAGGCSRHGCSPVQPI
jgi:hypothetical protein